MDAALTNEKGNLIEVTIEKLISGGKALAHHSDGRAIIVSGQGAFPDAVIELYITRNKKSHLEGNIQRVIKASSLVRKLEEHEELFGGCPWLPLPYETQLKFKDTIIHETLDRSTEWAKWQTIVPSPKATQYRNKVEWSYGTYISQREHIHDTFRFGFHASGSYDRIIDAKNCIFASDRANALFRRISELSRSSGLPTYDTKPQTGLFRHLVIRESEEGMMVIWSLKTSDASWSEFAQNWLKETAASLMSEFPEIVSFYLLNNPGLADVVAGELELIAGKTKLTAMLLGKKFVIRPLSFFQVNTAGAEKLYTLAGDLIQTKGGVLLDLYAGTGTIGICLAEKFDSVISVELNPQGHEDALENIAVNKLKAKVEAVNMEVEKFVKTFQRDTTKPLTILVDPPREGLRPDALELLPTFGADEIIYVSCNPATLARDIEWLKLSGYKPTDIIPVDMFPQTHHCEAVVRLEKTEKVGLKYS